MGNLTDLIESLSASALNGLRHRLSARIAAEQEIEVAGFVLGNEVGGQGERRSGIVRLSKADRQRHTYILGATGCGKTNLLLRLIDADVQAGQTVVVIDLRGDLADRVISGLATQDSAHLPDLCLIDLRQDEWVAGLNPLAGAGDVHARALHVLGVLKSQAEGWGVQLDETARNALVALTEAGYSLVEIEPLLTRDGFRQQVLAGVTDPSALAFFERFEALSPDRQSAFAQPVLNKVTPLIAIPTVRRALGAAQSIDLKARLDEPGQILLVALAVDRLHGAGHLLGGLLVSALHNTIMARSVQAEHRRNPVSLYIDEFENFASPAFESIVAEGRRFRLALTLSHQNLSQVESGLRQVLRNNVALQIFFQTGCLDASELAGEIVGMGAKDDVRQLLMTQPVGQAIVSRRAQPAKRVQTHYRADPATSPGATDQLRSAALAAYGCTGSVVDQEISDRIRLKTRPTKGPTAVRHDRRPRLGDEQ